MKTTRMLSLLLVLCLVLAILPVPASAATLESGMCGPDARYTLNSYGTFTVTGKGEMWNFQNNYGYTTAPWMQNRAKIKKLVIEKGITSVGKATFVNCTNLESVSLPKTLTHINSEAFYGCSALTTVNLPDALTHIGDYAFYKSGITEADLPEGLTKLGAGSFYGTKITSVTVPAGITTLGAGVFGSCNSLTEVVVKGQITDIGDNAFQSCDLLKDVTFEQGYSGEIGANAFAYCPELEYIDIPVGVTRIMESAFCGCEKLTGITLPEGLESIWSSAFRETAITSITIPSTVDYMGSGTFVFCDELENITMYTASVEGMKGYLGAGDKFAYAHIIGDAPVTKEPVFGGAEDHFIVYYDEGTSGWDPPTWNGHIIEIWGKQDQSKTGTCGENLTWRLDDDGTLTISGTGPMDDFNSQESPWFVYKHRILHVVIEEGVTTIGDNAFGYIDTMEDISIPATVETLGARCFEDCSGLKEVILPEGLLEMGTMVFRNCHNLTKVILPDSLGAIGTSAFEGCHWLTEVRLPATLTKVPDFMFSGCSKLAEIEIPGTVTELGWGAFNSCHSLETIRLPEGLEIIDDSFRNSGLTAITFPASLKEIQGLAFTECNYLENVYFTGDAPVIDGLAFMGITTTCQYPADNETWTSDVMQNYGGELTWVSSDGHVHEYTDEVTPPTCTEQGYTTHTCVCGDSYRDNYVDGGHKWDEGEIVQEPTDEVEGLVTFNCTVCGEVREVTLPKVEHVHDHKPQVTPATCTEGGYTTYTCKCGDSYQDDFTDPTGHIWDDGVVTTEPTEEAEGVRTFTCTACDETRTEVIPVLEHVHQTTLVEGIAPTETEDGRKSYYTCTCGKWFEDAEATKEIENPDDVVIPAGKILLGDVNGDGKINPKDAAMVLQHFVGKPVSGFNAAAADVNGDGKINPKDAAMILQRFVGKLDENFKPIA